MVDIGVGLTGLDTSVPAEIYNIYGAEFYLYDKSDYRNSKRVSASLLKENPKQIAADLLMPLIDAISQGRSNPFADN